MTDHERADALAKMQARRCGYHLLVWTYEDEHGVVHLLNYSAWRMTYALRCESQTLLGTDQHVPHSIKMPTCVRCVCAMSPTDVELPP